MLAIRVYPSSLESGGIQDQISEVACAAFQRKRDRENYSILYTISIVYSRNGIVLFTVYKNVQWENKCYSVQSNQYILTVYKHIKAYNMDIYLSQLNQFSRTAKNWQKRRHS